MSQEIEAMLTRVWEDVESVPDDERAYVGGRLIRMAQELLGPVYWPITLEALVQMELRESGAD
jgi:hypothetical protein